jgi:hypothetical protein
MNVGMPPTLMNMRTMTVQDRFSLPKKDPDLSGITNPYSQPMQLSKEDSIFAGQKHKSESLNLQLDSVLDAFRKSIRERSVEIMPEEIPREEAVPKKATTETMQQFAAQSNIILQEQAEVAQQFFSTFTDCAQPAVLIYLKLIYFKSQVDIFTAKAHGAVCKLIPDLYLKMKEQMVHCLGKKTKNIQFFTATYPIEQFEHAAIEIAEKEHAHVKQKLISCRKCQKDEVSTLLKLKEHIHGQTLQAWKQFFAQVREKLTESVLWLQTQYALLTTEYHLMMEKVVEFAPSTTKTLFDSFFPEDLDFMVIDELVKLPHSLLSLETLIAEGGPVLVCKYLKQKNLNCIPITLSPEELISLKTIFRKFAQLYYEYVNKLLQIDIRANLDFKAELSRLNAELTESRKSFSKVQQNVNLLIGSIVAKVANTELYLQGLDRLYSVEVMKLTQHQQELQIQDIAHITNKDFIFLHF